MSGSGKGGVPVGGAGASFEFCPFSPFLPADHFCPLFFLLPVYLTGWCGLFAGFERLGPVWSAALVAQLVRLVGTFALFFFLCKI